MLRDGEDVSGAEAKGAMQSQTKTRLQRTGLQVMPASITRVFKILKSIVRMVKKQECRVSPSGTKRMMTICPGAGAQP